MILDDLKFFSKNIFVGFNFDQQGFRKQTMGETNNVNKQ